MDNTLYERQLKWREDAKKKAYANSIRDVDEVEKKLTFKPHIYTTTIKKHENNNEIHEKSTIDHVRRQIKGRKDKESILYVFFFSFFSFFSFFFFII